MVLSPIELFLSISIFPLVIFLRQIFLDGVKILAASEREPIRKMSVVAGFVSTIFSSLLLLSNSDSILVAFFGLPISWALLIWGLKINTEAFSDSIVALFSSVAANFSMLALDSIAAIGGLARVAAAFALCALFFYILRFSMRAKPPVFLVDYYEWQRRK